MTTSGRSQTRDDDAPDVVVSRAVLREVVLATLPALRCISDGTHQVGCSTYDGAKARERLRLAVVALKNSPEVPHA